MDDQALSLLLGEQQRRQFWIVLWGDPEHSADEDAQVFDEPFYDHGFRRKPEAFEIGDILFVHRIHVSQIIFVGEVLELPRESLKGDSEQDWWRERWSWSVRLRNLTPEYGAHWRNAQRTFPLKDQYNSLHPNEQVNIGGLQHGVHVRIPESFAKFLLDEIMQARVTATGQGEAFRAWLKNNRGYGDGTVSSRLSNCRTVEQYEGSLDQQFEEDQLRGLLQRLAYSKYDERQNRPPRHRIPIHGNIYNGTATLRSAVSLHKQFRENPDDGSRTLRAGARRTRSAVNSHAIPYQEPITTELESERHRPPVAHSAPSTAPTISATQLADWRRKLISLLVVLEKNIEPSERLGIGARISRLQRGGIIPGEIGAMMKAITEMRNATEYEAKTLSDAESSAVKATWAVLQEWAHDRGIDSLA
ncbi:MAG: hypothetical protein QOE77_3032 [Blastocatellia bacterium]|jgi:hypothetical protein|nr:hypothetical protein [Blastocatellia bacterium]